MKHSVRNRFATLLLAAMCLGGAVTLGSCSDKSAPEDSAAESAGGDSLYEAAEAGDAAALKRLLDRGADINAPGKAGVSPLLEAIEFANPEAARLLVEHGADVNAGTPLIWAVRCGSTEIVELLIGHGADVNASDGYSSSLDAAMWLGYAGIARILLEHGAVADEACLPALHRAIIMGESDKAIGMIDAGADLGETMGVHQTPLHWAAAVGDTKVIEAMLDEKRLSCGYKYDEVLYMAVLNGQMETAKLLMDKGVDAINVERLFALERGTLLDCAVENGRPDMVKLLLERGADSTPSMTKAARYGHTAVVKLLLERGADADSKSQALLEAALMGRTEIANLLLDHGADVNYKGTYDGGTALHEAAQCGHAAIVRLLLERGADVNAVDAEGNPPLRLATERGRMRCASLLRAHGANE